MFNPSVLLKSLLVVASVTFYGCSSGESESSTPRPSGPAPVENITVTAPAGTSYVLVNGQQVRLTPTPGNPNSVQATVRVPSNR